VPCPTFTHISCPDKLNTHTHTAEWARLLLDDAATASTDSSGSSSSPVPCSVPLPRLQEKWRARLESLKSVEEDLAFVNAEIDTYNLQVGFGLEGDGCSVCACVHVCSRQCEGRCKKMCVFLYYIDRSHTPIPRFALTVPHTHTHLFPPPPQVPSLSLQRVRLRLDYLIETDAGPSSTTSPMPFLTTNAGGGGGYSIDTAAAAVFVRAAERDGVLSRVTSLGGLRLEAEEDRARQQRERQEKGRGRWSSSSGSVWGGSGSGGGDSGGGGGSGLFGSLTSWFMGGGREGKKKP
jgi:hypothetical protein